MLYACTPHATTAYQTSLGKLHRVIEAAMGAVRENTDG